MTESARNSLGKCLIALVACIHLAGGAFCAPAAASPARRAADDWVVYDDALTSGWDDWSWSSTVDFATASPALGSRSIAVSYQRDGGLSLHNQTAIDAGGYQAVAFWVRGSGVNARMQLATEDANNAVNSNAVPFAAPADQWVLVTVTLTQLGNPASFQRLDFQEAGSGTPPTPYTVYFDDIRLLAAPAPPVADAAVRIRAGGAITPIDPRLLGTNLATWNNPTVLANAVFRARTAASGVSVIRMPGGSYSNWYGWFSCETGRSQPGALPCGDNNSHWETWAARPTDFINFLRAVNKPGMWVVSINGTSKEAAAAVAFFNAAVTDTTPIGTDIRGTDWYTAGHWAQLRAARGNPQPAGIRLWGVGNEVYGGRFGSGTNCDTPWGWETVWTCDGAEYVNGLGAGAGRHEGFLEFRAAMRAVDPAIAVGAIGTTDQTGWHGWGNQVISAAGQTMDFYDVHQYAYDGPPAFGAALAYPLSLWPGLKANITAAFGALAGGRPIPIGITEHNLFSSGCQDTGQLMTRALDGLFVADSLGQLMANGYALANQWILGGNDFAGLCAPSPDTNTDYGLLRLDHAMARSPQYFAFVLWSRFGDRMLPVTSTLNPATQLSVYAGWDGARAFSLLAINKTARPITATVDAGIALLSATADAATANALTDTSLRFDGLAETALASDLSNAHAAAVAAHGAQVSYAFAPYSITLLRLVAAPAVSPRAWLPLVLAP